MFIRLLRFRSTPLFTTRTPLQHKFTMSDTPKKQKTSAVQSVGKLYHMLFYSSSRVVQLLHELDLTSEIEIETTTVEDIKSVAFLALNPHGKVKLKYSFILNLFFEQLPVYVEKDLTMIESAAIFQ